MSNSALPVEASYLSKGETRNFLTPFAFKIDNSLFGVALASPMKRGAAIFIDVFLIFLLSYISATVLAFAIAVILFRLGSKKRAQEKEKIKGYKRRAFMRFIAALMVFVILLDTLPMLMDNSQESSNAITAETPVNLKQGILILGFTLNTINKMIESECGQLNCWKKELSTVTSEILLINKESSFNLSEEQLKGAFSDISKATKLNLDDRRELEQFFLRTYQEEAAKELVIGKELEHVPPNITNNVDLAVKANEQYKKVEKIESSSKPEYSIIELVKGIINDLGLGFSWATFYFTVLTSFYGGQTLGKKALGIKVLQLDGTPLTLWDSFGRYGGYGAGLATGLLGFFQVYWDQNRQAIHDKIASTVVIDLKSTKTLS